MPKSKIAITLSEDTVRYVDDLVARKLFDSRSQAIQEAVDEKLARLERRRLAEECARLEPTDEQALADEGLGDGEPEWPEY